MGGHQLWEHRMSVLAFLFVACTIIMVDILGSCLARAVAWRLFPSLFPTVARYGIDTGFADCAEDC